MSNKKWNTQNIPDQKGKVILITGATSGLGKEAAKIFAAKGATVIMPVRNTEKAKLVCEEILILNPNAKIDIKSLDLSRLNSIKLFADEISKSYNQLDILINNAGIMYCPYSKTQDGFEMQMGTNHLGPDGFSEMRGNPIKVKSNAMSLNAQKAEQLWSLSEKLTVINY